MSTRSTSWGGLRRPVSRVDNIVTLICRLSWNLGASTSWNPQGLPRPVQGLLYLYILHITIFYRVLSAWHISVLWSFSRATSTHYWPERLYIEITLLFKLLYAVLRTMHRNLKFWSCKTPIIIIQRFYPRYSQYVFSDTEHSFYTSVGLWLSVNLLIFIIVLFSSVL
jgi:hypothetical protein